MPNENDDLAAELLEDLTALYGAVAAACTQLPVPVDMPQDLVLVATGIKTLARVVKIAVDQPMPRQQREELELTCLHWLAAAEMLGQFILTPARYRAQAAFVNLSCAREQLAPLMLWLNTQE